jgi:hypothetical protein
MRLPGQACLSPCCRPSKFRFGPGRFCFTEPGLQAHPAAASPVEPVRPGVDAPDPPVAFAVPRAPTAP